MRVALYAIVIIGFCVVYAIVGVLLVRRATKPHVRQGHNDVLVPLFLTAGTLYAVLLGFLVIAVWESYDAAKTNAAEEASRLTTLYRATTGMPTAQRMELRSLLKSYTADVVDREWSIQAATGGASAGARRTIAQLYGSFNAATNPYANSAISADFLHTLDRVADDRNRRTLEANESLSPVLWGGIIAGAVIVIAMSFLLYMERTMLHVAGAVLMAALIGSLIFMIAILNRPFSGPLALSAHAFEHSITVYASVDRGD